MHFCTKQKLNLPMLSDPDFSISKKYGVFGEKSFLGRTYEGIHRTTFVLDRDKKIIRIFPEVKPEDHPEEVLEFLTRHKLPGHESARFEFPTDGVPRSKSHKKVVRMVNRVKATDSRKKVANW